MFKRCFSQGKVVRLCLVDIAGNVFIERARFQQDEVSQESKPAEEQAWCHQQPGKVTMCCDLALQLIYDGKLVHELLLSSIHGDGKVFLNSFPIPHYPDMEPPGGVWHGLLRKALSDLMVPKSSFSSLLSPSAALGAPCLWVSLPVTLHSVISLLTKHPSFLQAVSSCRTLSLHGCHLSLLFCSSVLTLWRCCAEVLGCRLSTVAKHLEELCRIVVSSSSQFCTQFPFSRGPKPGITPGQNCPHLSQARLVCLPIMFQADSLQRLPLSLCKHMRMAFHTSSPMLLNFAQLL